MNIHLKHQASCKDRRYLNRYFLWRSIICNHPACKTSWKRRKDHCSSSSGQRWQILLHTIIYWGIIPGIVYLIPPYSKNTHSTYAVKQSMCVGWVFLWDFLCFIGSYGSTYYFLYCWFPGILGKRQVIWWFSAGVQKKGWALWFQVGTFFSGADDRCRRTSGIRIFRIFKSDLEAPATSLGLPDNYPHCLCAHDL